MFYSFIGILLIGEGMTGQEIYALRSEAETEHII